jgi:hypothetical protein
VVSDGQLNECHLTLRELTEIREAIVTSLVAIYHGRIDYPGFNVPTPGDMGTREIDGEASVEPHGVTYENPSDVPINPAGEVEDEAIPHEPNTLVG